MNDLKVLIDDYVSTRNGIDEKIAEIQDARNAAHASLKKTLLKEKDRYPEWLLSELESYVDENDPVIRYELLSRFQFSLSHHLETQTQFSFELMFAIQEIERVLIQDVTIAKDLLQWQEMRRDIDIALIEMDMHFTSSYLNQSHSKVLDEIKKWQQEKNVKNPGNIYLSNFIEKSGDDGIEEEIVNRLSGEETYKGEVEVGFSITNFSRRQQQVINLLLEGFSYAKIGEWLGISKNTVYEHVKEIRRKCEKRTCFQVGFNFEESAVV